MSTLTISASFVRFMVSYDYLVYDEVECDPYTESCFVYCEDENCIEPFYYVEIERLASNLVNFCDGNNVDCEEAYWCQPNEKKCRITYCDPTDDPSYCDELSETDLNQI